jgi:hypothetical protein
LSTHEFKVTPTCKTCGAPIERFGEAEPKPDDIMRCPVHGDIGRYESVMHEVAKDATRKLGESQAEMLRKAGFKVTKN